MVIIIDQDLIWSIISSLKIKLKIDSELTEINLRKTDGIGPSIYF